MAVYKVTYQLPDYSKYLHKEVEADSQEEAMRIFKADMPGAKINGRPQLQRKKK